MGLVPAEAGGHPGPEFGGAEIGDGDDLGGLAGQYLDVNAAALGYCTETRLWATGAAVAAHPEVAFCAATTGPTNLLVSIVCRDSRDLYRYLTERLGALPLIGEIQTAPVIRVIKRAGLRP
ncbi:Lrp/AsnC family transcriptional regulator [Nonomuraea sp. CA-143628]|uniref:Lrp/AsnC family transcriptional regulator n=1 Tax=Nonomuraea sp. CA-143628 TaxID=3239997 RepID=UPI003D8D3347